MQVTWIFSVQLSCTVFLHVLVVPLLTKYWLVLGFWVLHSLSARVSNLKLTLADWKFQPIRLQLLRLCCLIIWDFGRYVVPLILICHNVPRQQTTQCVNFSQQLAKPIAWVVLENRTATSSRTSNVIMTRASTYTLSGLDTVKPPDESKSSLTDTLSVSETSKVTTPEYSKRASTKFKFSPHFSFVWISIVYYRIFAEDGAVYSKAPADPSNPFLGRIKSRSVPPPHHDTARGIKCSIAKVENIEDRACNLFLTPYSQSPMGNADKVTSLNSATRPLALVARISDSERSALKFEDELDSESADTTTPAIRYRTSIQPTTHTFFFRTNHWGKCTIYSTPTITNCPRK